MAVELRPQANQYVLGISSLWLLIPGLQGLHHGRRTLLAAFVVTTCVVSTAYWMRGIRGSFLHTADLACARCLFLALLYATGGAPLALPVAAACCYIICESLFEAGDYDASMWAHLLFRFLGYWWTHIAVLGPRPRSPTFSPVARGLANGRSRAGDSLPRAALRCVLAARGLRLGRRAASGEPLRHGARVRRGLRAPRRLDRDHRRGEGARRAVKKREPPVRGSKRPPLRGLSTLIGPGRPLGGGAHRDLGVARVGREAGVRAKTESATVLARRPRA